MHTAQTTLRNTTSTINQYGHQTVRTMCEIDYGGADCAKHLLEITTFSRGDEPSKGTELYVHTGLGAPEYQGYYHELRAMMAPYLRRAVAEHGRRVLQSKRDHEAGVKRAEWHGHRV